MEENKKSPQVAATTSEDKNNDSSIEIHGVVNTIEDAKQLLNDIESLKRKYNTSIKISINENHFYHPVVLE